MAKWFYLIDSQQYGPEESAVLKQLAATGHLKLADKVRREDLAEWHEAKQVNGLFAGGQSQADSASAARTTQPQPTTKPAPIWWPLPDEKNIEAQPQSPNTYTPCPHCGVLRMAADATSSECRYCGRKFASPPLQTDGHSCLKCKGTDIKTFEYVHALGKTKKSLSVVGGALTDIANPFGFFTGIGGATVEWGR